MRTSSLFGAKNFGFFEFYGESTQTRERGLSQYGHFSDEDNRRGSIFHDFVRTSFMDGPLLFLHLLIF